MTNQSNNFLPIAAKIVAQTIGLDLVAVKPLTAPNDLMYMDFRYSRIQSLTSISFEAVYEIIKVDGLELEYVYNVITDTYEISILEITALQQNGFAIQFIKNPTIDMIYLALKTSPPAIKHIKDDSQYKELCIRALNRCKDLNNKDLKNKMLIQQTITNITILPETLKNISLDNPILALNLCLNLLNE